MFAKLALHRLAESPYAGDIESGTARFSPLYISQRRAVFNVVAHYAAKPAAADEVLALLAAMAEATRKEQGNISYDFYRGVQDPNQIVILESYHDAGDFDRHRESPHFLELGAGKIIPRLASRHVSTYTSEVIPHEVP